MGAFRLQIDDVRLVPKAPDAIGMADPALFAAVVAGDRLLSSLPNRYPSPPAVARLHLEPVDIDAASVLGGIIQQSRPVTSRTASGTLAYSTAPSGNARTRSMSSADASGSYASSEESAKRCWSPG